MGKTLKTDLQNQTQWCGMYVFGPLLFFRLFL